MLTKISCFKFYFVAQWQQMNCQRMILFEFLLKAGVVVSFDSKPRGLSITSYQEGLGCFLRRSPHFHSFNDLNDYLLRICLKNSSKAGIC